MDNKIPLQTLESTKSSAFLNLRLEWKHVGLTATVREGPFYKRSVSQKQILNDVSGSAEPGELLAIMGPSGGGKTSLLNSLSRRTKISSGKVLLNGKKIPKNFNKLSAYVMQDDRLFEVLTPRELFQFSANLRLPRGTSAAKRQEMIEDVITKLKMKACADTRVGGHLMKGLSGGERKRTAIGYELITNPGLLFLDEPTTGLDSSTAYFLLETLKELSREGHTIICTIHQPSSEIFSLFDKLNLLVKGQVAYFGPAKDSIEFFGSLGSPCPEYTNPADYFMTILQTFTDEDRTRTQKFVTASKERAEALAAAHQLEKQQSTLNGETEADLEPAAPPPRPPFFVQLYELTKRNWVVIIRNPLSFRARIGQTLVTSLLVGCVYYHLEFTYGEIRNRQGGLFYICVSQIMSSLNSVLLTFPLERSLLIREQTNGMYGVSAYFFGKTVSALPLDIFFPTLFSLIVYWMMNLNTLDAARFFLFWFSMTITSFSSSSLGLLLGCMLPNAEVAVTLAPVVIMPFMLFGGFFMKIDMIPAWLRWLQYLSLFKWSFQSLVVNEFHDTPYTCAEGEFIQVITSQNLTAQVCPITNGDQILSNYNFSYDYDYWAPVGIIIGLAIGFRILALIFLQWQTSKGVKKDQ